MSKYLEYFEGAFDASVAEKVKLENKPYVAYSIRDNKVIYTIIPKEEGTMYTIYRVVKKDISNCTYNMVDLGLSVKWADRNVGASSPEHYGSYFQWGDTNAYTFDGAGEVTATEMASLLQPIIGDEIEVTKDNVGDILLMLFEGYDVGTDLTNTPIGALGSSLDKLFNRDSYFDTTDGGSTFNKYNNNGGLTVLESSDDAAAFHMGTQYRMPTSAEIQELISGTTQIFIDLDGNEYSKEQAENGVIEPGKLKGVRFTSSNGNSIFIPAAGDCVESLLGGIGMYGKLWSSSLYVSSDGSDGNARNLIFYYDGSVGESGNRYYGRSVRGVEKPVKKYLTFKAEEDNSSIGLNTLSSNQTMEYSADTVTWNTFDTTTDILLNKNEEVYIRGMLSDNNTDSDYTQFKMSGKIAASGNCNTLWNYEDLNTPLKKYCGADMFSGCTSLITAPELPAIVLAPCCYDSMFVGCTSLTTAPELPATMLTEGCYQSMFNGCTSLTTAPELPALELANGCYGLMFSNCTSLTTAPELPATVLVSSCYAYMFSSCSSLTTAPAILPATELTDSCYWSMFGGCTNLNYIKCLATDISADSCTYSWVKGVSPTGTFVKHPNMTSWSTGTRGIPSGWTVEDAVL